MKQAKSSELVKEHHEIIKGDGEDRKINRIRDKKRPPIDKGKVPENSIRKDQKIKGNLKTGNGKESTQEIFVVENLKEPLLGRPGCEKSTQFILMTV